MHPSLQETLVTRECDLHGESLYQDGELQRCDKNLHKLLLVALLDPTENCALGERYDDKMNCRRCYLYTSNRF